MVVPERPQPIMKTGRESCGLIGRAQYSSLDRSLDAAATVRATFILLRTRSLPHAFPETRSEDASCFARLHEPEQTRTHLRHIREDVTDGRTVLTNQTRMMDVV